MMAWRKEVKQAQTDNLVGLPCDKTAGGHDVISTLCASYANRWNGNAGAYNGDHFILNHVAFACNERNEVRDLHDVAGALCSTQTMKQQTFVAEVASGCITPWDTQQSRISTPDGVSPTLTGADSAGGRNPAGLVFAAGFNAGAGSKAAGSGYMPEGAPTIKGSAGGNSMPSVLILDDQGGERMDVSRDVSGTLRAKTNGHLPIVFENHSLCD
jgi:DNA (cytosine-5)-methyltransferase 1